MCADIMCNKGLKSHYIMCNHITLTLQSKTKIMLLRRDTAGE